MKKKILFTLLSILLPLGIRAQEAHWQCNEHDFQYDKTIYVFLELEDQRITDLSNYDIAAFCGNECRGFVDVKKNEILETPSGQVAILRVRTNNLSASEIITFKVYDKTEEEEINVANTKITFSDETAVGSGSSPFKLDITIRYTPGDTNDDGEIDLTDASLVFRYYTEFDEDIEAMAEAGLVYNIQAADVNGDGEIDLTDASLIFRYYTEFDEDVDAMNEAGLTVLIPSK